MSLDHEDMITLAIISLLFGLLYKKVKPDVVEYGKKVFSFPLLFVFNTCVVPNSDCMLFRSINRQLRMF